MLAYWPVMLFLATYAPAQLITDTAGFTARDRQVYGPAIRYIVNDTMRGIHIVWKTGYGNILYNFCPCDSTWRWENGVIVNEYPRNLGCLGIDITTGQALIGTDYLSRGIPQATYFSNSTSGNGVFVESRIAPGYRHVLAATSRYGWPRFAALRNDSLFFLSPWSYRFLEPVGPFPSHNLASSKQCGRFGYIFSKTSGSGKGNLFLKETPNNGANWYTTVNLSDSVPSDFNRSLLGGCAIYDSIRLHLVVGFYDGARRNQSQIWHYAKYDSPPWHLVHQFVLPDSVNIGDCALAAGRPSIGRNPHNGEYYIVWEQFNQHNIDHMTGLCRADIWASRSCNNGKTWGEPVRLTQPDETSKRFPFLAEVADDTLHIIYFADQVAGFWEQNQGPRTINPVIHLRVASDFLPAGIAQSKQTGNIYPDFRIVPTISNSSFMIYTQSTIRLQVFNNSGRMVANLVATKPVFRWNPALQPGVYFIRSTIPAFTAFRILRVR